MDAIGKCHFAVLTNAAATESGTGKEFGEVDTGGAKSGTLYILFNPAASSDLSAVEVWTSVQSAFTMGTAVVSDSTALVKIHSDLSGIRVAKELGTTLSDISDLTVSSYAITAITEKGLYAIDCPDVSRYLNVEYTGDGTGSEITAIFVGHDVAHAPNRGPITAY